MKRKSISPKKARSTAPSKKRKAQTRAAKGQEPRLQRVIWKDEEEVLENVFDREPEKG